MDGVRILVLCTRVIAVPGEQEANHGTRYRQAQFQEEQVPGEADARNTFTGFPFTIVIHIGHQ
ncbi:hypothetical protein D3C84_1308670 [compost metagenome]